MINLVYCSAAARLMSSADLPSCLHTSRVCNQAQGITGMLLYHDGSFMQALEGDRLAVRTTYQKILLDPRHRNLIKLLERPIRQRSFGEWSMSYVAPDDLTNADWKAYSDFLGATNEADTVVGSRAH